MKNSKVARRKENGGQILLKMGFLMNLSKRKSKDEDLKKVKIILKKYRNWKNHLKTGNWEIILKSRTMRYKERTRGP